MNGGRNTLSVIDHFKQDKEEVRLRIPGEEENNPVNVEEDAPSDVTHFFNKDEGQGRDTEETKQRSRTSAAETRNGVEEKLATIIEQNREIIDLLQQSVNNTSGETTTTTSSASSDDSGTDTLW